MLILNRENIFCQEPNYECYKSCVEFSIKDMKLSWEGCVVENRGILGAETATVYRVSCMKSNGKQQHLLLHVVKKLAWRSIVVLPWILSVPSKFVLHQRGKKIANFIILKLSIKNRALDYIKKQKLNFLSLNWHYFCAKISVYIAMAVKKIDSYLWDITSLIKTQANMNSLNCHYLESPRAHEGFSLHAFLWAGKGEHAWANEMSLHTIIKWKKSNCIYMYFIYVYACSG